MWLVICSGRMGARKGSEAKQAQLVQLMHFAVTFWLDYKGSPTNASKGREETAAAKHRRKYSLQPYAAAAQQDALTGEI